MKKEYTAPITKCVQLDFESIIALSGDNTDTVTVSETEKIIDESGFASNKRNHSIWDY